MSNGMERRSFLKVLGVSGAGAGLSACSGMGAADKLIPYVVPHEDIVPGIATWYRTTCRECPAGCGMSIRTREGRAVKAEGNPLSPISHGRLCARGQASLHGLYNPDRIRRALARAGEGWDAISWDDAEQRLAAALNEHRGRTVFLTHPMSGSMDRLIDDFSAAFGIERVRYEPFAHEALRAGYAAALGAGGVPVHDFAAAEVVVSFGADFLETWLSPVDYAHGFVRGHSYDGGRRGRLIWVGPHQPLTGMNADEWVPCRPGTEHLVALALASLVGGGTAAGVDVQSAAEAADVSPERLRQVATAFANGGRSLAVGPGVSSSHTAAVEVARGVALLNQAAGNVGRTVLLDRQEVPGTQPASFAGLQRLLQRMQNNEIGALLVHGPNPLYSVPGEDVATAFGNVAFVASFSTFLDETSARAHLLLPDHHFLESWDDYVPRTGITTLVQPVMTPVFDTKQTGDVLLSIARRSGTSLPDMAPTYYDYLRARWGGQLGGAGSDDAWREALQVGFVLGGGAQGAGVGGAAGGAAVVGIAGAVTAPPAGAQTAGQQTTGQQPAAAPPAAPAQAQAAQPTWSGNEGDPYLLVYPSYKFYDGRNANRPWLQELPDPVTKSTWSTWVELNPELADELGIDDGHIAEVATPFGTAELPAWRHPGIRRDTIAIQLGQGHDGFGTYADGRGLNALRLLAPVADAATGGFVWQQTRASIRNTGRWERPASAGLQETQEGRDIALALSLADAVAADRERGLIPGGPVAVAEPDTAQAEAAHAAPGHDVDPMTARVEQLQGTGGFQPLDLDASPRGFPPPGTHYGEYTEVVPRWAMAIDLEKCIGCGACTTACYAENNIGIVGPEQIAKGRILHWIRIERYFEGEGEGLQTRFLPMMCQHCGNAPCEPVCPVYAAYHTPDGLNGQVYNRCVGTRYCANNCPYKVRVFNWFSAEWPEPLNWQLNPDVTVREKGVMEKCTMCVQRIRDAENHARLENRGVRDGEITPACAQTCPGDAIVFGNIRDTESRVSRVAASGRGYRVLEHLNTQSAIVYLKKVTTGAAEG